MKMKRILSLIVAVLMIMGTMGAVAFAADDPDAAYAAKLGEDKYETFAAALAKAQAGDTVTLLADVKLTGKLTIDEAITIDGDGHSIIADETAVWYTVSGKLNLKSYKTHLIGVNSNNVTLKNIVLDNNNNAAGINIYCAQNVVFDNVSIINATKGDAALTVNGSTLTVKNKFEALGHSMAIDISNGSGVTSALGITVEEGTVFNLDNKVVRFASVAAHDMTGAKKTDGTPYFAAMDNAYYYTATQMQSRTTAYSNGLTLLADVEVSRDISVKGTLNLNGNTLKIADDKVLKVDSNLTVAGNGTIDGKLNITKSNVIITGAENLDVTTSVDGYRIVYNNGIYSVQEEAPAELPNAEVKNMGSVTIPANEYICYPSGDTSKDLDLDVAMQFIAKDTPEEAAANYYGQYTTDFFIEFSGIEGGSFNTEGCYLAGHYGDFGWIAIPVEKIVPTIQEGMVYPVLSGATDFNFTYEAICEEVKDFTCGIYFSDAVKAANPNITVKLSLGLSENVEAAKNAQFTTVGAYEYDKDDFGKKLVNWVSATDAGFYMDGETEYGMMRFLFHADVEAKDIIDSGIKYVRNDDITDDTVVSKENDEASNAFYGDIIEIPEGTAGAYTAVAYIITSKGLIYWSDAAVCSPNFTKLFTEYKPAQ